jgi:hypothetical protein
MFRLSSPNLHDGDEELDPLHFRIHKNGKMGGGKYTMLIKSFFAIDEDS